ncbi:MAG TPA: hypothetical protein VM716_00135 [Gemmatimonadales bacterium]|nr:hypothetical protein [Gemmatimonadales bacterium]
MAIDATALRRVAAALIYCGLGGLGGLGCKQGSRANQRPADAGTVVTVYVPPRTVDRLMGRLQSIAARRQWVLSIRTDSGALADADLVIADSGGKLVAHVRPGSPAAAQARLMGEAVLP